MKHRTFCFFSVFALVLGFGNVILSAADIKFTCDVEHGFNFQRDQQFTVGYITSLTIGPTTLRPDLSIKNPNNGNVVQAVAVLGQISWNGGAADPLKFTAQISTANKQAVALLVHQKLSNLQVQIAFKVFAYDPQAKKYFETFVPATDTPVKGTVVMSGTPAPFTVASNPDSTVKNPANFEIALQVAPAPVAQSFRYATADSMSVMKKWGVANQPPPAVRSTPSAGADR